MIEFTADMQAIIKQAILSFVATVNEDGTPNLSPKASLTATNGVLCFADIASPRTILNYDDESLVIANWVRATNGLEYPVDHVVKIETTSIAPSLSPVYVFAYPHRNQDEIRSTYYQKYGVKPIGA